jgi:DNA-binding NarL/FixJ family response regulator
VAIVDSPRRGRSGLWMRRKLKRLCNAPAVVIYSAYSDYVLAAACVVAQANSLVSKSALGADLCERIREAARGESHLPIVPPSLADSMRRRLDSQEQAIFGMMLAGIATAEIGRIMSLDGGELEARQWAMLRKVEGLDRRL